MNRHLIRNLTVLPIFLGLAIPAAAQNADPWSSCITTLSTDWDAAILGGFAENPAGPLYMTTMGIAGVANWVCPFGVNRTYGAQLSGNFGFGSGETGSVQTTLDDYMMFTPGMPLYMGNSMGNMAIITQTTDGTITKTRWGSSAWTMSFRGTSDRYFLGQQILGQLTVDLRIDLVGDAARYQWDVTNNDATPIGIGMWTGHSIALATADGQQVKGWYGGDRLFIAIPGQRPTNLETRWHRKENPAIFPPYINFDWSQDQPYGLRIETGPTASTTDPLTGVSDATQADHFELGNHNLLMGELDAPGDVFPDGMFPIVRKEPGFEQSDIPFIDEPAYILKFDPTIVNAGKTKRFVMYYRTTWGQSDYVPPYAVVVDAPKLFNYDPNNLNGLTPNPATVRVWVDNIRGFTTAEQEIPLQNVRITLDLTNTQGINLSGGGKIQTKSIAQIDPRVLKYVDFLIEADGTSTGIQPMKVTVVAAPGPTKTVIATTDISTTPRIPVVAGANLLSMPWNFSDSSWASILGLSTPTQFQAFEWDPVQQGYVLSTSAQRGRGTWIVFPDPNVIPQGTVTLQSDPSRPADMTTGSSLVQLGRGWNLIGNPFPYPIPLGEIIGVSAGDPTKTYKWNDLVNGGFVNGALAYWDTTSVPPTYRFISGPTAYLDPNKGYWVYVNDTGLTLQFPPVFYEGAITASGSPALASRQANPLWVQSDKQWHLQLAARTNDELDDQNWVGVAASDAAAKQLTIYEPPMGPTQNLAVSMAPAVGGTTRLAQAMSSTTGAQQWTVFVQAKKAGQVTVTWPNMSTVPKNMQFRLLDKATGTSRDMRRTSGYTFTSDGATTREFTIQAQTGVASRAVIGNVVISRTSRAPSSPFVISYTLSGDATTTIRILGSGGREIFTATRGRADRTGENSATWALRDNANRAVAPGIYRVEITAETADGERVRKIVPLNVVR